MPFKQDLANGVKYTALSKYLSIFIGLLVTAVLSRILTPNDFGVIAIATVLIGFVTLLTGSGLSPAIIQKQNLSSESIEDLFSFTFYLSFVATLLFLLLIPAIEHFYKNEELRIICYFLLINVFFSVINIVPNALLFKQKKFKYIAIRTIAVQSILGLFSVIGALNGLGIYALLINPIVGSILLFIISYRCYNIRLKFKFDSKLILSVLPYSSYQIGFNILNYTYRNLDKVLIGRYMGMSELGYYEKSYRLMMMPLENFSNVINPVIHPLLSEYQNNWDFIFDKYKKLVRYFGYLGFILTGFCFVFSQDIVLILFGPQWEPSVIIFKILSLSIGFQMIQSAVGAIFQATGKVKLLFYSGIISFIIITAAIAGGILLKNINYLAILLVISFIITFLIYHFILIQKIMNESLSNFLLTLGRPLLAGGIIGGILHCFKELNISHNSVLTIVLAMIITLLSVMLMQETKIIKGLPNIYDWIKNRLKKC